MADEKKYHYLLLELGILQFFCYQTEREYNTKAPYHEVFWKKKSYPIVYGPFPSIHEATDHATRMLAFERNEPSPGPIPNNLIYVDFKTKRRLS
jgi:hypothetical protein